VHPIGHFRSQAVGDVARVIPGRASSVVACMEVLRAYPVAEAGFLLALREVLAGVPNADTLGGSSTETPRLLASNDDGPREPLALTPTPQAPAPRGSVRNVGLSPSRRSRSHERFDAHVAPRGESASTEEVQWAHDEQPRAAASEGGGASSSSSSSSASSARNDDAPPRAAESCLGANAPERRDEAAADDAGPADHGVAPAAPSAAAANEEDSRPRRERTEPPPLMRPAYHVPKWRQEQRRREEEAAAVAARSAGEGSPSPDPVAAAPAAVDPFFVVTGTSSGPPVPVRPTRPPSPDARLLDPMDDESPSSSPATRTPKSNRCRQQPAEPNDTAAPSAGWGGRRDDPVDPLQWESAAGVGLVPTTCPAEATTRARAPVFVPDPRALSESEGRRPRADRQLQHEARGPSKTAQGLSTGTSRMLARLRMARSRTPPTSTTPSRGGQR
jgi:hypothetical protein